MRWKNLSILLNLVGMLLLLITLSGVSLWPKALAAAGLDMEEGRLLLMHEVSFLLLLGAFQESLTLTWRRAALAGSFVVLSEATLMALL